MDLNSAYIPLDSVLIYYKEDEPTCTLKFGPLSSWLSLPYDPIPMNVSHCVYAQISKEELAKVIFGGI